MVWYAKWLFLKGHRNHWEPHLSTAKMAKKCPRAQSPNQQHDANHCHLYAIDQSSRSVLMITVMIIIATSTNVILTMMRPMRLHVIKNIEKESYRLVDIIVVVVVIIIIIISISISMFFRWLAPACKWRSSLAFIFNNDGHITAQLWLWSST